MFPSPARGWRDPENRGHIRETEAEWSLLLLRVAQSQVREGGGRSTPTAEMGPTVGALRSGPPREGSSENPL